MSNIQGYDNLLRYTKRCIWGIFVGIIVTLALMLWSGTERAELCALRASGDYSALCGPALTGAASLIILGVGATVGAIVGIIWLARSTKRLSQPRKPSVYFSNIT